MRGGGKEEEEGVGGGGGRGMCVEGGDESRG